jgi:glycine/D-amino acid oxidase-like deaminating enzyme
MSGREDLLQRDPSSHGLWARSAAGAPRVEALSGALEVDVVVVGGGFTGLSAALALAEHGASVAVLEARGIGFGASGRNAGLVNAGLWLSPGEIVKRLGNDYGERLMGALGNAPERVFELIEKHDIRCELRRTGTLHCAHSPSGFEDLRRRAEEWKSRGAPVELLDREAAARRIGTDHFHGALLDHRAGTVQPLGYARGLAAAAARAGARIFAPAPVRSLARRDGKWRAETDAGPVTGRSVILATNAYTEAVAAIARCIVPFSYFQLSTPPLPPKLRETILPEGQGAWDTAKILTSLRLDDVGRLIVGSIGRLDPKHHGINASWMRRKTRRMFPELGEINFEHGWYGTIGTTIDHLPRLSQPDEGFVAIYGYNGRGIGPGTVFGSVLADYFSSGDAGKLPLPFKPMTPAPARSLRALGIEVGVRAYHFLANRF